ncbi:uncharacterized protein PAN0_001d0185 [Moesziomyces antarcticus]|uniref:Uncharacterized protein n=1 Tax=Pseudozyma antarctica TaxID=84753 RepID=A0A5C3FDL4_PSEA2|nr:uncharacterized protein PAN0_001d0185 [Moesziomyces antarcticus]GAK61989.1 hypothetical protein PAN0_001d0185 [Moesziomyces antarcticus]SPO42514.1 uncharacterized protein PSANT_00197 [Moesziomyces antarcticus]
MAHSSAAPAAKPRECLKALSIGQGAAAAAAAAAPDCSELGSASSASHRTFAPTAFYQPCCFFTNFDPPFCLHTLGPALAQHWLVFSSGLLRTSLFSISPRFNCQERRPACSLFSYLSTPASPGPPFASSSSRIQRN